MTTARTLGILLALIPSLYAPAALAKKPKKDSAAQKPSVDEWGQEESPMPAAPAPSASTTSTSSKVEGDRAAKADEAKHEEKAAKTAQAEPSATAEPSSQAHAGEVSPLEPK